jgi:hypothetical protein
LNAYNFWLASDSLQSVVSTQGSDPLDQELMVELSEETFPLVARSPMVSRHLIRGFAGELESSLPIGIRVLIFERVFMWVPLCKTRTSLLLSIPINPWEATKSLHVSLRRTFFFALCCTSCTYPDYENRCNEMVATLTTMLLLRTSV